MIKECSLELSNNPNPKKVVSPQRFSIAAPLEVMQILQIAKEPLEKATHNIKANKDGFNPLEKEFQISYK